MLTRGHEILSKSRSRFQTKKFHSEVFSISGVLVSAVRRPPRLWTGLRSKVNIGEQGIFSGNSGVVSPSVDVVVATDWNSGPPISILPRFEGTGGFALEDRGSSSDSDAATTAEISEGVEGCCFV